MAFRRRFRRRFFRRARTEWVDGASFVFDAPDAAGIFGFPLVPTLDGAAAIFNHTVAIPLFADAGLEASHGFTLRRIVGELLPLVTRVTQQGEQEMVTFGADIRGTFQATRIYPQTPGGATSLHSKAFAAVELGEENILHTQRWLQPMNDPSGDTPVTPQPMTIDDMLAIMTVHDLSGILPGAIATSQFQERMVDTLTNPSRCNVDIRCKRKVTRDERPFLYFDVRDATGVVLDSTGTEQFHLRLSGWLRFLVTRSR